MASNNKRFLLEIINIDLMVVIGCLLGVEVGDLVEKAFCENLRWLLVISGFYGWL